MYSLSFTDVTVGTSEEMVASYLPTNGPIVRLHSWNVAFNSTSAVDVPVQVQIGNSTYSPYGVPATTISRVLSTVVLSGYSTVGPYGLQPSFTPYETYEVSARAGFSMVYDDGPSLKGVFASGLAMVVYSPTSSLNVSGNLTFSVE